MAVDNVLMSLGGSSLLFQVQAGVQTQLGQGPLVVAAPADDSPVITKVGDFQWRIDRSTPCLRTDDHTYTFAIPEPNGPPLFYCLILPPDAAQDDVELLQSVLASTTAYSASSASTATGAGAEAGSAPGSEGQARSAAAGPGAEQAAAGGSSAIPETLLKGASFLGSSFRWAAGAASAGITAAKEKAEASLTPETRAKLDNAKTTAWSGMEKVGTFAGKVVSDVKTSTNNLVTKVADSEFARSESVRNASRVGRDVLSTVYRDMQKAGDSVVAAAKEAAAKVRKTQGDAGSGSGGVPTSAGSGSAEYAVPVSVPGHAPSEQAPATGIPVSAPGIPISAPAAHYPAVPPA